MRQATLESQANNPGWHSIGTWDAQAEPDSDGMGTWRDASGQGGGVGLESLSAVPGRELTGYGVKPTFETTRWRLHPRDQRS